jgi:hypothetical protein
MTSNTPREHTATHGTTASRAYAQQALDGLHVTRDAVNDDDPAGIDIGLRMADVYARLAQAAATAEIAAALQTQHHQRAAGPTAGGMSTERGSLDVSGGARHPQPRGGGQRPGARPTETTDR